MKGRMRPYLPELTIRDYNTYQWYQRGVRRQLYTTYGLYSCYGLRYNGVLFAVLADSLAGRPATCKRMREPGTLVWRQMMCQTQGIRLAAQVEVLLSWHRIQDAQWADLPFYKKVRRVVDTVLLRQAYRKAAAENPALERIFVQERDQANVQMTLNAKNYLLAAEPKGNLYGALYSVLATDDPNQRKSMHYIGSCIGPLICWTKRRAFLGTKIRAATTSSSSTASTTGTPPGKTPGGRPSLRSTTSSAPTGCWTSS